MKVRHVAADYPPEPGDFRWDPPEGSPPRHIHLHLPRIGVVRLPVYRTIFGREPADGWAWDGNLYAPTLQPSINSTTRRDGAADAPPLRWHGYLTAGELREC